ncbi:MAG: hypothetical protein PHG03_00740 [Bacilli bacterium]|nr:hypothetical protein [Bacilli bacterium]MDD4795072.1 hypothetical protein [Bacilli bacterium]
MKNRYLFFKRKYNNYLLLVKKKDKYHTFNYDKLILNFINFKNIRDLQKNKINYIIIDNLEIEFISENEDNNYQLYLLRAFFINMIKQIEGTAD